MKSLWAPWRMTYLNHARTKGCIFCVKPKNRDDRAGLILHRGQHVFVMMNLYPYSNGHLMVSPYRHTASIEALEPPTLLELMQSAQIGMKALRRILKPDAFNLGINQGREAGAGIESHVHLHIVPRWNGDTNFMPLLADVRVIPEHLEATYDRLHPLFAKTPRKTAGRAGSRRKR